MQAFKRARGLLSAMFLLVLLTGLSAAVFARVEHPDFGRRPPPPPPPAYYIPDTLQLNATSNLVVCQDNACQVRKATGKLAGLTKTLQAKDGHSLNILAEYVRPHVFSVDVAFVVPKQLNLHAKELILNLTWTGQEKMGVACVLYYERPNKRLEYDCPFTYHTGGPRPIEKINQRFRPVSGKQFKLTLDPKRTVSRILIRWDEKIRPLSPSGYRWLKVDELKLRR
jgi:hypothetical protein